MNESRESKNAEQLEELLLLTEEIQAELEQKDQLIVELKTQLSESLTLNEKLNKENRALNQGKNHGGQTVFAHTARANCFWHSSSKKMRPCQCRAACCR